MKLSARLIIYLLVLFVWTWVVVVPARAQPELKVGQEVEIYLKEPICIAAVAQVPGEEFECVDRREKHTGTVLWVNEQGIALKPEKGYTAMAKHEELDGYRILKPATRPEFKLPAYLPKCFTDGGDVSVFCIRQSTQGRHNTFMWKSFRTIEKELRYLREEIEALKK